MSTAAPQPTMTMTMTPLGLIDEEPVDMSSCGSYKVCDKVQGIWLRYRLNECMFRCIESDVIERLDLMQVIRCKGGRG